MNPRDRQILKIALPSIVSNITVPLLGLIDVAIVGHMGNAAYIGAVAVGSMIFNLIYWLFAFLRMGTSGMTAQALGERNLSEDRRILHRSLTVAFGISLLILVLQLPLRWLMFWFIGPTSDVAPLATTYFYIVVWGAPAALALFSLNGWFIGLQNTRFPMLVSIVQNVVNILTSFTLVYGFGMKIEGVALGTVIAQYAGFALALALVRPKPSREGMQLGYLNQLAAREGLPLSTPPATTATQSTQATQGGYYRFFSVNRDIFLRTLCLVSVNLYFTSAGARSGAVILSVNTVLLQLYLLFSYFMDGFANAGEALSGRAWGARDQQAFRATVGRLFRWAIGVTLLFTIIYIALGPQIVAILTDEPQVRETAATYLFWAWLIPAAGATAFIWDGVFIGITATRGMLTSAVVATLFFFAIYWGACQMPALSSQPALLNHALWLAQIVYLLTRGVVQTIWFRQKYK